MDFLKISGYVKNNKLSCFLPTLVVALDLFLGVVLLSKVLSGEFSSLYQTIPFSCKYGIPATFIKMKIGSAVDPDLAQINTDSLPEVILQIEKHWAPMTSNNPDRRTRPTADRIQRFLVLSSQVPLSTDNYWKPWQTHVCFQFQTTTDASRFKSYHSHFIFLTKASP